MTSETIYRFILSFKISIDKNVSQKRRLTRVVIRQNILIRTC